MKDKTKDTYIEPNFEKILRDINLNTNECEVLYNLGGQEVVKKDGKYFLSSSINPNISKEISRESAQELWDIYNLNSKSKDNNVIEW